MDRAFGRIVLSHVSFFQTVANHHPHVHAHGKLHPSAVQHVRFNGSFGSVWSKLWGPKKFFALFLCDRSGVPPHCIWGAAMDQHLFFG